jgi:hypothetical protein
LKSPVAASAQIFEEMFTSYSIPFFLTELFADVFPLRDLTHHLCRTTSAIAKKIKKVKLARSPALEEAFSPGTEPLSDEPSEVSGWRIRLSQV